MMNSVGLQYGFERLTVIVYECGEGGKVRDSLDNSIEMTRMAQRDVIGH